MTSARRCFFFFSLFLFLPAAIALAAPPTTTPPEGLRENTPAVHALVGARIVVAPGRVIEKGTLVIRDGIITGVAADLAPPADAKIHDLSGRTLYAGFIDAYGEMPVEAKSSAAYWNAQVRPQASVADQYQADAGLNAKLRTQGITARLVAPAAGIIKGTSAIVSTGDEVGSRAVLRGEVAQHLRLTVSRGVARDQYPNSPMGAVALARQTLYDADWHRSAWLAYQADASLPRPERNDALLALQQEIDGGRTFIAEATNELYFLRADQFAREFGLKLIVRGSGREYRRLDAIRQTGRAVIVPLSFPKSPNVATPEAAHEASLEQLMHWDLAPENAGRLDRAGVKIALTSHGLQDPTGYLAAVRQAVERGLSPDSALRAITTTPAELFGASDRLGTLESGKIANVVVTDGDLFEKKTKVIETWVDGRQYEPAKPPLFDVRGTWQVSLAMPEGRSRPVTIELAGKPGELSGELKWEVGKPKKDQPKDGKQPEKADAKLAHLSLRDSHLSATLPGKPFEIEGAAQISVVVSVPEKGDATWLGHIVWPDGTRLALSAKRTALFDESKAGETATPLGKPTLEGETPRDQGKNPKGEVVDEKAKIAGEKGKPDGKGTKPKPTADEKAKAIDKEKIAAAAAAKAAEVAKAKTAAAASSVVNFPLGEFGRSATPEQPKLVFFTNATVWTASDAGIIENASLLIGEGKILAIGADLEAPAEAVVINLKGKHVSPGIIDCHSHMATDGGINETGQAITAEVRVGDFINHDDISIYRQLAGGVTTANILHGSANPIGGQNQVIKLRWGALYDEMKFTEAPAGIKFALGENVKQSNWGERFTTRYPQTRLGVEQILRDEFQAARDYAARRAAWQRDRRGLPPRRDLELDAIAEVLDGRRWVHCHSYRQDEILATLRVLEDFQVRIGTFQHILEGYKVADAMARHGAMGSAFSDWWAYKLEVQDAIPYAGALMHKAGVVVSFNSDDAELARHLNHEAAKAMKYGGLPPAEAIKFVTANPARQLRIERYVGSLEPGKHADLAIWSSSPLSTLSRCEETWVDGRKYFDRAEDQARRKETHKLRALLVQKALAAADSMRKPGEEDPDAGDLWPSEDLFCRHHGHGHDD